MNSLRAELIILLRLPAVWALLGIGTVLSLFVGYIAPYIAYLGGDRSERSAEPLGAMLPDRILPHVLQGFPFYVAMFGLILGAVLIGNEFSQGTLKTVLIQHPHRSRWLLSKMIAIGLALLGFTLTVGLTSGFASAVIAINEGVPMNWPGAVDIVQAIGAGWLILLLWGYFGAALAMIARGTSMAIGLGILYGLVIEGLVSAFGTDIAILHELSHGFLRANGYSLIEALGATAPRGGEPGAFPGPLVGAWTATTVMISYLIVLAGASTIILRMRDVT